MSQSTSRDPHSEKALDEHQSKELLKTYGVPTISETVVKTPSEAMEAARKTGFPVVLKALGETLLHKTERRLVRLDLNDETSVSKAAKEIADECGEELEGYLIQPQLTGRREFVAGLVRDPQFGPAVMFGLGGVFTEALSDVTFRVAPLTEIDAGEMLSELSARKLLKDFRGEKAAKEEQLVRTLIGLSKIGVDHPEISEIDINPLIVTKDGEVCAVDALVVKKESAPTVKQLPPVDPSRLKKMFSPKSIALVGATASAFKWGERVMCNIISGGFKGELHLVNPRGGEIYGRKAYKTVEEIPVPVDLGIVTIPAKRVPELIPQFEKKGIKHMLLISAGFGEAGQVGQALESELLEAARKADLLILGPNTMGICNPHEDFYGLGSPVDAKAGGTAVVTQSGNMGVQLLGFAEQEAIGIRAFSGSGNESMITIEDYLNAFEHDDVTRIVMLYIEGIKDGRRFLETARRVSRKKPVVLLKGGRSSIGKKAAASHTGSLSSDVDIFNAACRQAGIITVAHPMELLDMAAAFSALPLPKGNRVAVVTMGGGWGVLTADLCADHNIEIPELSEKLIKKFDEILPEFWSRANPVDIVGEGNMEPSAIIMEELAKWDGCDAVINLGIMGKRYFAQSMSAATATTDPDYPPDMLEEIEGYLDIEEESYVKHLVELMEKHQKPILGVSLMKNPGDKTLYEVEGSPYKGIFFKTPERAVKTLAKMWDYQQKSNNGRDTGREHKIRCKT